jgi:predicted methyltransferase
MIVLSHYQTTPLLAARRSKAPTSNVSLDLGQTETTASLDSNGVRLSDGAVIEWATIERIAHDEKGCYTIDAGGAHKLVSYSEATKRPCSLFPTRRAPALLLSGMTMHRIKGIDPIEDTERKIRTIEPVVGTVLDTTTGLGYTVIAAARRATRVTTIELDREVLELARSNPWSRDLFENSKITQLVGDCQEVVAGLPDRSFDRIIHDPPMIKLAGDLYSTSFYEQLFRVLRPGGKLFHYIGDPESPGGHTTTQGVMRRLATLGFKRVVGRPEAFGVVGARE